jgi:hypothetical protein
LDCIAVIALGKVVLSKSGGAADQAEEVEEMVDPPTLPEILAYKSKGASREARR